MKNMYRAMAVMVLFMVQMATAAGQNGYMTSAAGCWFLRLPSLPGHVEIKDPNVSLEKIKVKLEFVSNNRIHAFFRGSSSGEVKSEQEIIVNSNSGDFVLPGLTTFSYCNPMRKASGYDMRIEFTIKHQGQLYRSYIPAYFDQSKKFDQTLARLKQALKELEIKRYSSDGTFFLFSNGGGTGFTRVQ